MLSACEDTTVGVGAFANVGVSAYIHENVRVLFQTPNGMSERLM